MSWINGHWYITQEAINGLREDCPDNPLIEGLQGQAPQWNAALRDIYDILNGGHWDNDSQHNHFMRRFESQTDLQAYEECVEYVRARCMQASRNIQIDVQRRVAPRRQSRRATCPAPGFIRSPPNPFNRPNTAHPSSRLLQTTDLQPLGDALHAVQDSFSESHVERSEYTQADLPGTVEHLLRYQGAEREHHGERDSEWRNFPAGSFTLSGRAAIVASRELMCVVLAGTTQRLRVYDRSNDHWRFSFERFRRRFLRAGHNLQGASLNPASRPSFLGG